MRLTSHLISPASTIGRGQLSVARQHIKTQGAVATIVLALFRSTLGLAHAIMPLWRQRQAIGALTRVWRAPKARQNRVAAAQSSIKHVNIAHRQHRSAVAIFQVIYKLVQQAIGLVASVQTVGPTIVLPGKRDALRSITAAKDTFALQLVRLVSAVRVQVAPLISTDAGSIITAPLASRTIRRRGLAANTAVASIAFHCFAV